MKLLQSNTFSNFELQEVTEKKSFDDGNQKKIDKKQIEQLKIFKKLENNLDLLSAPAFGKQVHFKNAYETPIQRWFPYREGYSTQLVYAFLQELDVDGVVFDPFSGSGTTLLAARKNNLHSFGIDVNPISVLVSKVENANYTTRDIKILKREIETFKNISRSNDVFVTNFPLADRVFNVDILQTLLQLKSHIREIVNSKIQDIFFVAWLSIIEEVSNIKKEGNGIKYKNRKRTQTGYINLEKEKWEQSFFPENKFLFVKSKLISHLKTILFDIKNHFDFKEKRPVIFQGDCLSFDGYFSDDIQFTFFSPPYCNCFDYFEIHKVELWLGDFVTTREEFKSLRNTGFRSNTNSLNQKEVHYRNKYLENLISLFDKEKLWNNRIPSVVRGYFDDTYTLLSKLFHQTEKGGYVGIVVGNSAYTGVIIPTDVLIANIASEIGFKVKNVFVARHLTTSSQQKKRLEFLKNYLRESIVVLEK